MSIQHFALVWAHSTSRNAARLVAVALAQHANASTDLAWPSIATIMAETNLGERSVRAGLAELVELGEWVEAGEVNGTRAWRLVLECPGACDGSPAHVMAHRMGVVEQRRATERARKRAQRAAVAVAEVEPQELVEATVEELSRQILPGHGAARSGDRTDVPADFAGMSRQIMPGQGGLSLIRELSVGTTTTSDPGSTSEAAGTSAGDGAAPPWREAAGAAGASADAAAGGGEVDVEEAADVVLGLLPAGLRTGISRRSIVRYLAEPLSRGVSVEDVEAAFRGRSWEGARTGAVVTFLRDLEPRARVERPRMVLSWCEVHPGVETTRGECPACVDARRQSRAARGAVRREGESMPEFLARISRAEGQVAP